VTGRFRVEPAQLSNVVEQMSRFEQQLQTALEDVDARVTRLHATWTGTAAEAHQEAHERWQHGAPLVVMRQIATTAHSNYTNAVTANTSMWGQAL
jgi:WXG100 family type VII secretion target